MEAVRLESLERGSGDVPSKSELLYTSHYCEENIYQLLKHHTTPETISQFTAIFLSNATGTVPLFSQRLAKSPLAPVIWDYHVILVRCSPSQSGPLVYDFDTTIEPFPAPFHRYFRQTFTPPGAETYTDEQYEMLTRLLTVDSRFKRLFRLVPAQMYLDGFSSSRVHMMSKEGSWLQVPPAWGLVRGVYAESDHTLPKFLDFSHEVETDDGYGIIVDQQGLWEDMAQR